MVGRKKKTKICDKVSEKEDRISHLPDSLICEILTHLSTKDVVRTSVLSTKWRNIWQLVPGLDLDSDTLSNGEAFVSFVDRFLDSHRESWIRKLRLSFRFPFYHKSFLTRWVDAETTRRIQHLDVKYIFAQEKIIPQSIYTCQALVHLRLGWVGLDNADFVSLPCLKILHLESVRDPDESTLQKLVSDSPVLEDLTIIRCLLYAEVLQLHSNTLKRIDVDQYTKIVIDAPLLQCLRATINSTKNVEIINLGFFTKLDIDVILSHATNVSSLIHDILADISYRGLGILLLVMEIFQYSKSGPVLQFRDLSRLNTIFSKSDIEMLPTLLESCPKLESFILELVEDHIYMRGKKKKEPKVMFSTVPLCLVSSLKFVELKHSISRYEGEMELIRYFLKNSTILEKFRLNVYYKKKLLKEIVAMPRCSSACEVIVL